MIENESSRPKILHARIKIICETTLIDLLKTNGVLNHHIFHFMLRRGAAIYFVVYASNNETRII